LQLRNSLILIFSNVKLELDFETFEMNPDQIQSKAQFDEEKSSLIHDANDSGEQNRMISNQTDAITSNLVSTENVYDQERYLQIYGVFKSLNAKQPRREIQARISDQLLQDLAYTLIDKTVMSILIMLRAQQQNEQNSLVEWRDGEMRKLQDQRQSIIDDIYRRFDAKEIDPIQRDHLLNEMERNHKLQIDSIDQKIINSLDSTVKEQQKILMDAMIPGFFVTEKYDEKEIQMKLLDFINQFQDLSDESYLQFN
ncbi:Gonadal protein gdl, partial [Sarcoptes scabiei]